MGWAYAAGASGTVTLPVGAELLEVTAQSAAAGGTVTIFGGTAIPVVGAAAAGQSVGLRLGFAHKQAVATTGALTIVFASTVSYFVQYLTRP